VRGGGGGLGLPGQGRAAPGGGGDRVGRSRRLERDAGGEQQGEDRREGTAAAARAGFSPGVAAFFEGR
jgi:hypothetical protein